MSSRPPPKISLRHDHDWTRGNVPLGSTVDQQPVGKLVRQSRGEVQHAMFSQLTQPIPKPICDRSGQPEDTQGVFVEKGGTSRSFEIDEKGFHGKLCASDGSGHLRSRWPWLKLVICLKTPLLSKLTMDQGNLMRVTHSERTTCSWRTSWNCVIQHERRVQSCNQRGRHWLKRSRRTAFYSETKTRRQRSRLDWENKEPPESAHSSTRPTTKSIIQSLKPRIKRNESWSWERRIVWTTRCWTPSTMQSVFIILGRGHRLLHVRTLLAQWKRRKSEIHQVYDGPSFNSRVRHQERTTSRTSTW